jgi:hypothetical protein
MSDDDIAQHIQQHLGISPAAFLAAATQQPPRSAPGPTGASKARSKQAQSASGSGPKAQVAAYESVEAFVGVMGKLLGMERDAEVAAATEATSLCSTTAAQVRTAQHHDEYMNWTQTGNQSLMSLTAAGGACVIQTTIACFPCIDYLGSNYTHCAANSSYSHCLSTTHKLTDFLTPLCVLHTRQHVGFPRRGAGRC